MAKDKEKQYDAIANRPFEMIDDIAYFVSDKELDYNVEFAKELIDGGYVEYNWNRRSELKNNNIKNAAKRIVSAGGLIMEMCTGPGGGLMPHILDENSNAGIIITDLCPTVVKEWKKFLDKNNNIKNIKYAALNICDIPFKDETCDIISGYGAFINIEGDKFKALKEIYRVIKHGGMFVTDHIYVTKEYVETLPVEAYKILRERFPSIFMDFYQETLEAGFKEIEETAAGEWSNENDESTLASLCRELGIHLVFSTFFRYCHK